MQDALYISTQQNVLEQAHTDRNTRQSKRYRRQPNGRLSRHTDATSAFNGHTHIIFEMLEDAIRVLEQPRFLSFGCTVIGVVRGHLWRLRCKRRHFAAEEEMRGGIVAGGMSGVLVSTKAVVVGGNRATVAAAIR